MRTTTTKAPAIQKAGEVKIRVAKPPDEEVDVDVLRMPPVPMEPTPPRMLPKSPLPLPMNEVNKLIYYMASYFLMPFGLRLLTEQKQKNHRTTGPNCRRVHEIIQRHRRRSTTGNIVVPACCPGAWIIGRCEIRWRGRRCRSHRRCASSGTSSSGTAQKARSKAEKSTHATSKAAIASAAPGERICRPARGLRNHTQYGGNKPR